MNSVPSTTYSVSEGTLVLSGTRTRESVPSLYAQLKKEKQLSEIKVVDINGVEQIDTNGVACIEWILDIAGGDVQVYSDECSEAVAKVLDEFLSTSAPETTEPSTVSPGFLEHLGERIFELLFSASRFIVLTAEIFYWSVVGVVQTGQRKKQSVVEQCWIIGVQSLPLVALLSIILGVILSLQSALQLRNFGANIYVANLMAISMVNEMGPMMTAILLAGRSGSAIASEVATMKVSEEIEALEVMGIDPIRYVVVPKFLAITLSIPLLVAFSIYIGIAGGVFVGATSLDITPTIFISRSIDAVHLVDVVKSLMKSVLFGWIIVVIGSYFGFSVSGGSEEVGRATTLSVVYSIITIIILDGLFSLTTFL